MNLHSLLQVKINFATSQNVFPHIIEVVLAILFVMVIATRWRRILAAVGGPPWPIGIDQIRFFGTLALTIIYFLAMPVVGDQFPNTGLGFYFASIPYILAIGLLYLHNWTRRTIIYVVLNAVIAPTIVWYVLANLFNISLP
jgi:hypothetical protein